MAIHNMRVEPNTPIAKSLGFNPHGVIVDNITPYWLYFPQAEQYCPPFTAGWSAPFIAMRAGYAYMEIQTPFGQTNQTNVPAGVAQYVNLTWTDNDVAFVAGESAGSSGASIDPVLTTSMVSAIQSINEQNFLMDNAVDYEFIAGIPDKTIRLLDFRIAYYYTTEVYVPVWYRVVSTPGPIAPIFSGHINGAHPVDTYTPIFGLDYPVGEGVRILGAQPFAGVRVDFSSNYQVLG